MINQQDDLENIAKNLSYYWTYRMNRTIPSVDSAINLYVFSIHEFTKFLELTWQIPFIGSTDKSLRPVMQLIYKFLVLLFKLPHELHKIPQFQWKRVLWKLWDVLVSIKSINLGSEAFLSLLGVLPNFQRCCSRHKTISYVAFQFLSFIFWYRMARPVEKKAAFYRMTWLKQL